MAALAALPDGRLASCSGDSTVWIWDVETGAGLQVLTGHRNFVYRVVALPGGRLASCSYDVTVRIWNYMALISNAHSSYQGSESQQDGLYWTSILLQWNYKTTEMALAACAAPEVACERRLH